MAAEKRHLLLMYDRPLEPLFNPKGEQDAAFVLPPSFLTSRYQNIGMSISNQVQTNAKEKINIKEIPPPNLGTILDLKRDENFSLFFPKHREVATQLINLFMGAKDLSAFLSLAAYCRDRVNPYLFNYAFSVAILHRPDTTDMEIPTLMETFPDKYLDSQTFTKCREETYIVQKGSRRPIEIPVDYTASDLENEHRLAYWREDLGINIHHWHWHLVYPFNGPRNIVAKDRRGELFYYFHQQMQARYNVERMCNNLNRVKRYINWREPIEEAYYPKLDSLVAGRSYPGRPTGMTLQDVSRTSDQWQIDIQDIETFRSRIYEAVHSGFYLDESGQRQPLTEFGGIDVLGNIVEASILTPNRNYYGDIHNNMHAMLSVIHDPDLRHLESYGTIGDPATSMRDPIFFGLHAFVNDVFLEFKATLPRYTVDQLKYDGVTVTGIETQSQQVQNNTLSTFWQQSDVDMSRGLDFQPRGSVFVRFTHLQHQPFNYVIKVNNQGQARQGTCRIFLGPKVDERGNPWLYRDQKDLMIEMDRFIVNLTPGENVITQSSSQSALTVPFERTFRNLDLSRPVGGDALEQFNYCGCGWPQYLLLPKGNPQGYRCELFVMISDIAGDRVNQTVEGQCNDAPIYCGLKDKLYPDRRSMGYPFDRMPRQGVETLQQFLLPNMRLQDVTIRFHDSVVRQKTQPTQKLRN